MEDKRGTRLGFVIILLVLFVSIFEIKPVVSLDSKSDIINQSSLVQEFPLGSQNSLGSIGGAGGVRVKEFQKLNANLERNVQQNISGQLIERSFQVPSDSLKIKRKLIKYEMLSIESTILDMLKVQNKSDTKIRVVIRINESFSQDYESIKSELISILAEDEFEFRSKSSNDNWISGNLKPKGLEKLKNNPYISIIHEETIGTTLLQQSLPLINVNPDVWVKGYTGKDQTICVIDTGINSTHNDLNGKVVAEYCYCSLNEGGSSGCCPDGTSEDDNSKDNVGHGTYVAGIVAAKGKINGTAPDAKIVSIKITNSSENWADGDLEKAIKWCDNNSSKYNISVITVSLGTRSPVLYNNINDCEALRLAVDDIYNANSSGIFVDIASGNDANLTHIAYPACVGGATSVGAVYDNNVDLQSFPVCSDIFTAADKITCFTNRGNLLDLLAPGCKINSTNVNGGYGWTTKECGTSFAAPHVAGAATLLLEKDPTLKPDEIKTILQNTGISVGDWKRINVLSAIDSLDSTNATVSGTIYNCTETGYDQCIGYSIGDCNVSIAVNHYTSVNNIKWGAVNDSSDPYVIKNYTFGWKAVKSKKVYYNVIDPGIDGTKDCDYGGCDTGEEVSLVGTKATVNAPGTAFREIILGYNDTSTTAACWTWFNEFSPNYGASNPIYVLNCFDNNDCQSGYYCNKNASWFDWHCVLKKGNGQSCASSSECSSGYCDNDGVGLSDDLVCFTPYNNSFDGQEKKYCEISTGFGDINCDEKEVGDGGCTPSCRISTNTPQNPTLLHPNGGESFKTNITINWSLVGDSDGDFVRYDLQYSNNSGTNWYSILSNYGYENKLNDSSIEKELTFNGNEDKIVYIRIPKKANVTSARIDLIGEKR
ncbi:MAG: S8 family serine peptidase [Nanoarchaeota archaeon]